MPGWIPLSDAALRLGMSYHRAMRLMHVGRLEARKQDNGRWVISEVSLNRLLAEREAATLA